MLLREEEVKEEQEGWVGEAYKCTLGGMPGKRREEGMEMVRVCVCSIASLSLISILYMCVCISIIGRILKCCTYAPSLPCSLSPSFPHP